METLKDKLNNALWTEIRSSQLPNKLHYFSYELYLTFYIGTLITKIESLIAVQAAFFTI